MTTGERIQHVYADADQVAVACATRLLLTLADRLQQADLAHVVLTGGTVGIKSLAAVATHPALGLVAWDRVHLWWGDERFLPTGDPERNETQARTALLDGLSIPTANVHPMPADDGPDGADLDAATRRYAEELAGFAGARTPGVPDFDVLMLGMGPDGHIASLFPGHDSVHATGSSTVAERDSPKPPPQRISLTMPAITTADQVWVVVAGAEKADPAARALAGGDPLETPAAGAIGRVATLFLMDRAAARS